MFFNTYVVPGQFQENTFFAARCRSTNVGQWRAKILSAYG